MDNSYTIIVLFIVFVFVYYVYVNTINKKTNPVLLIANTNNNILRSNNKETQYINKTLNNLIPDILGKINKNLVLMSINRIDKVDSNKYNVIFFVSKPSADMNNDITYKFNIIITIDFATKDVSVDFIGKSVHKNIKSNSVGQREFVDTKDDLFYKCDLSGLDPRFIYG